MRTKHYLGELEQMVLWAILRLDGKVYGPRIIKELEERIDRRVTPGALYATLDRLETKRMVTSTFADPEPGRGGRRKRYLTVTPRGVTALETSRSQWRRMWDGLGTPAAS